MLKDCGVDSNGHEVDPCVEIIGTPRAPSVVAASSVARHAIDATPARWRGDAGSSPLDRARTTASSPTNERGWVHLTHWLIYPQVDPDATVFNSKMAPTPSRPSCNLMALLIFRALKICEAWRTLSDAELLSARVHVPGRENDAIYPLQYVASLTGRAILVANRRPTPPLLLLVRRPKYYDVRASLKLKKFDSYLRCAAAHGHEAGRAAPTCSKTRRRTFPILRIVRMKAPKELLAPAADEDADVRGGGRGLDAAEAAERRRAAAAAPGAAASGACCSRAGAACDVRVDSAAANARAGASRATGLTSAGGAAAQSEAEEVPPRHVLRRGRATGGCGEGGRRPDGGRMSHRVK